MSFELKFCRPPVRLLLLALITFCALAGTEVKAQDVVNATLRVCLKGNGGEPIMDAHVVRKGGRDDFTVPPDQNEKGCYARAGLPFGDKSYSLEIKAPGYQTKPAEPLDTAGLTEGGTVGPRDPVTLTKEGTQNQNQGGNQNTGQGGNQNANLGASPSPSPSPAITSQSDWKTMALVAAGVNLLFILLGALLLFLLSRRKSEGQLPAGANTGGVGNSLILPLQNLSTPLKGILEQQAEQTRLLGAILAEFKGGEGKKRGGGSGDASGASRKKEQSQSSKTPAAAEVSPVLAQPPGEESAKQAYGNFLRGQKVLPEPIFLSVEGGSSASGILGGKQVVLEENSQGALVLFRNTDGDESGWLYPNTTVFYREETLRKVFPSLTEFQFTTLKQSKSVDGSNVRPVTVKRLDASRWQVSGEQSS